MKPSPYMRRVVGTDAFSKEASNNFRRNWPWARIQGATADAHKAEIARAERAAARDHAMIHER